MVVLVVLVAARLLMSGSANSVALADAPAPDALVAQVTGVPAATLEAVGRGTVTQLPTPVRADVERGPTACRWSPTLAPSTARSAPANAGG